MCTFISIQNKYEICNGNKTKCNIFILYATVPLPVSTRCIPEYKNIRGKIGKLKLYLLGKQVIYLFIPKKKSFLHFPKISNFPYLINFLK